VVDWPASSHKIRLLTPGVFAVTTILLGLEVKESTTSGLLTYTRFRRVRVLMKIDRPTRTCSGWLANSVELLSAVVTSGKVATCTAVTELAAAAVVAGMVAAVCAWLTPQSIAQMSARYVPPQRPYVTINIPASVKTSHHLLIAQYGFHLVSLGPRAKKVVRGRYGSVGRRSRTAGKLIEPHRRT
jgi:hypothetical protein